ncbi:endonuclease/exonuclease/phosphatase family protein [Patescibacteria group bacterium AH-259-L05]|nr:endonuclease/exonuclease/phosphatase family protein [Patescibacteria group bacterium AH-259-L05]
MNIRWRKIGIVVFTTFILLFTTHCAGPQAFVSTSFDTGEVPEQIADTSAIRIRILTYNIFHGGLGSMNIRRVAKVINAVDPDVVALQEVDRGSLFSGRIDQPAELARLTNLTVVYGPNVYYKAGGEYGNAVLTRFPVIRQENHLLPYIKYFRQRGILEVELGIGKEHGYKDNFHVRFFVTHLDNRKNDAERIVSVDTIEAIVQPNLGTPMILAGDLNDAPESSTLSIFRRTWEIAGDGKRLNAFRSFLPRRQIDYILFHPQDRWRVVEIKVIRGVFMSDHLPVFAVLEWIGDKNEMQD